MCRVFTTVQKGYRSESIGTTGIYNNNICYSDAKSEKFNNASAFSTTCKPISSVYTSKKLNNKSLVSVVMHTKTSAI